MSDQEVFENQDDAKRREPAHVDEQRERILGAFGALHEQIGRRISHQDVERVGDLREALLSGDRQRAAQHLETAKSESSWLYEELMKHPEISAILRELSIMGL
ncbi:MAG: hypothetical protein Q8922_11575 [Bacteroidota bacterium]|nr:hypothetical protein [Bacteroidota bacterium]MDP4234679.1 hypothetical protein [Bacteroidota bacterium]MDP4243843.1 hypothetical protein [Bacteroidota bacterium]MDP4288565.1 hypothetical protein [Bacteroidota bacterium]